MNTLPFDIPEKDKRKYQCFVCGIMFKEFNEFKSHIIENHEEGREYIICPLEHCGAPVRDMRMHFKCKHPHAQIPKSGMMKAMIWKDHNNKSKREKTKKPKFREGWYHSTKMGKPIHYRSGYEETIYECLDSDIEVNSYDAEPFEVPYLHEGKAHKYIPDLVVRYVDGRTEVWEIKPANQTLLERNINKWTAADKACQARGWQFLVMTEVGIDKLKQKVKNQRLGL